MEHSVETTAASASNPLLDKNLSRKEKLQIWREMKKSQPQLSSVKNSTSSITPTTTAAAMSTVNSTTASSSSSSSSSSLETNKENINKLSGSRSVKVVTLGKKNTTGLILANKSLNTSVSNSQSVGVNSEEYNNLKSKYRNLQKLHKSKIQYIEELESKLSHLQNELEVKSELIKSLRKSSEESTKKEKQYESENAELKQKTCDLENSITDKDAILEKFAKTYVPKSDLDEALSQIESLIIEEKESEEIISLLKNELETCMQQIENVDHVISNDRKDNDIENLKSINMSLAAQVEQYHADVCSKDEEISLLKEALTETLQENNQLYQEQIVDTCSTEIQTIEFTECSYKCNAETQTSDNYELMIKEARFIAREFQNMKIGNDLMYQQMTQIQENSKKQMIDLRQKIRALELECNAYKESNERLLEDRSEKELEIEKLMQENEKLKEQNKTSLDEIFNQAFSQAEQMAMSQIAEIMDKYSECEQLLECEKEKCMNLEVKLKNLMK